MIGVALTDRRNRLLAVRLGGRPLPPQVADAVLTATMSYSTSEVGQFTLTVQDSPDAALIVSGAAKRGQPLDYGAQHLVVRTVQHESGAAGPVVTIKARSRVVAALKAQTGKKAWGTTDVAAWASGRVAEAKGRIVAQPLGRDAIVRQDQTGTDESSLDVLRRLADQAGAWLFEADQTVYLGRPSWLAKRAAARRWPITWTGHATYSPILTGRPSYRGTDDGDQAEQLELAMIGESADQVRPGHVVTYSGRVGEAGGTWIVTQVDIPGSLVKPVSVTCARPTDPKPQKAG